ncbi:hypothetical protein [Stigmatella aurantiaca]|uniref:hypothetical protein n=1 Tax=Stigmatella aurantiaca TaxID=41 RepID=UPI00056728C1|nr:hypothetical protein [Stigmatella aurantiaca]
MRSNASLISSETIGLLDAHVSYGSILTEHLRNPVFVSPEPNPGRFLVNAADEACGHEKEILIRLALHVHGEQLHIVRGQRCEHALPGAAIATALRAL